MEYCGTCAYACIDCGEQCGGIICSRDEQEHEAARDICGMYEPIKEM